MKIKSALWNIPVILLLLVTFNSAFPGDLVKEDRHVSDFNRVTLAGFGKVILTQGDSEFLTIEADKKLLPYIQTEVRGHTLYLDIKEKHWKWIRWNRDIKFYITMKFIEGVSVSGFGEIVSQGINTDDLDIKISGYGEIDINDLRADVLDVRISGSGDCYLSGRVDVQTIKISGSGSYDAEDLNSGSASIKVSGSGDSRVWTENEIDVKISGNGRVDYRGNPDKVNFRGSGSGSLNKVGS